MPPRRYWALVSVPSPPFPAAVFLPIGPSSLPYITIGGGRFFQCLFPLQANKDWNPSPPRIVKILTRKAYEGDLSSLTSHAQQVRIFNGIDLTALEYKPFHGIEKVEPAEDLSGMWYDLEQKENAEETPNKEDEDEKELAAVAVTA